MKKNVHIKNNKKRLNKTSPTLLILEKNKLLVLSSPK